MTRSKLRDGGRSAVRAALGTALALLVVTSGVGVAAALPGAGTAPANTDAQITNPSTGEPLPAATSSVERAGAPASVEAAPGKRQAALDASVGGNDATITGRVLYRDEDGDYEPARQVKVEVRDKDAILKGTIVSTRTDDQGRFSLSFDPNPSNWGDDPDWGKTATVVVRVYADNPAAKTTRGAVRERYKIQTTKLALTRGETKDLGQFTPTRANNPAFQAADWALEARRSIAEKTNGWTRGQVRIQWPAGDWPRAWNVPGFKHIALPERSTADWGANTVHHEYGHTVTDATYEGKIWKWPVPGTDHWSGCHVIDSETDTAYAWIEGWAEFTEGVVADSPNADGMALETGYYYQGGDNGNCFDGDRGDMDGARVEGSIAAVLWDLYDDPRYDDDGLDYSLGEIVRTVDHHDVKNVHELWSAFRTDSNHAELRKIYFEQGIVKSDRFEGESTSLSGDDSVDAQISTGDVDKFHVDLAAGERLTADVSFDHSEADIQVTVNGPDGSQLGQSDTSTNGESVSVTASAAGTYTVVVADRRPASAPYTLDLSTTTTNTDDGGTDVDWDLGSGWFDWGIFEDIAWADVPELGNANVTCGDDSGEYTASVNASMGWSDSVSVDSECPVEVTLTTHGGADLDLFVTTDGRVATPNAYDRQSTSATGSESIRLSADERSSDVVGVGVEAYTGASRFTVVVEEVERSD